MRAPYSYYGGKTGLSQIICGLMPPHRVYIEPFFGSGSVFFHKPPSVHEFVNDVDDVIVTFLRCLRDRREELEAACALSPHSRTEFNLAKLTELDPGLDDIEIARRFWVRVNQSFGKTAGEQTGFSRTTARTQAVPASIRGRLGRFEACALRLMDTTIENTDAVDLIDKIATADSVVYADPPYLADTRRSRRDGDACADYRHDMGDEVDHERLAEVLLATQATVFLAGYPSPLYDRLYADWDRREWKVHAHGSNAIKGTRGTRTEVLWSNRPFDDGRLPLFVTDDEDAPAIV